MAPNIPVRDENGEFSLADGLGAEVINPLAQIANTYNKNRVMKLNGFGGLSYNFLDHFTAEANFQFNYAEVSIFSFDPIDYYGGGKVFNTLRSGVFEGFNIFRDYTFDGFIKYQNTFNEAHNLNVLLGTSVFKTTGMFSGATASDIKNNDIRYASVELGSEQQDIYEERGSNPKFDGRLLSYFARLQYDYKGKYLLSAVVRRDGSTRFGPGNKFGIFPSGSIGWVVSDEEFMNDNNFFDLLKLRGSYGILGNDRIGDYRFVSLLTGEGTYFFGGNDLEDQIFGIASGPISNPQIKWEKQKTFDVGLDARFLNNRFDLTVDYYKRRTEDLLITSPVSGLLGPNAPGALPPVVNAGIIENSGFEVALGYSNDSSNEFHPNHLFRNLPQWLFLHN